MPMALGSDESSFNNLRQATWIGFDCKSSSKPPLLTVPRPEGPTTGIGVVSKFLAPSRTWGAWEMFN